MKSKLRLTVSMIMWAMLLLAAYGVAARAQTKSPSNQPAAARPGSATPAAASSTTPVTGSGTGGQITKWVGYNNASYVIGDSVITEDKYGKIGIGTTAPTSKLTVAGTMETLAGGVKFPDGTLQTTAFLPDQVVRSLNGLRGDLTLAAGTNITVTPSGGNTLTIAAPNALTAVAHNATLTGSGTAASPLGIADSGVGTPQLANNSVLAAKIASGNVVKGLNGLKDSVTLAAGSNITITPVGNTLTIASTTADPEKNAFQAQATVFVAENSSGGQGQIAVPSGKRFVIEYLTISATTDEEFIVLKITTTVAGISADYFIPPTGSIFSVGQTVGSMVRIYSDGNVGVSLTFDSPPSNDTFVYFTLSGHLVDLP